MEIHPKREYLTNNKVRGPYSNVNRSPGSHWYGNESMIVYDSNGTPVCHINRLYHYDGSGDSARALAAAIAKSLTDAGFVFDPHQKNQETRKENKNVKNA
jgi:hypothetical protein